MIKKSKPNTSKNTKPKKLAHDWEDYYCRLSFRVKPVNSTWLEEFAHKWVTRATSDQDYKYIYRYPTEVGISEPTITKWRARSEAVQNAYEQVRAICKMRQLEGSMDRKLDGNFVKWMLPMFDEETKKLEEWRSKLKDESDTNKGPQVVVIEKFPELKG